ncbi:MAG TPA: hypothetical protein VEB22_15605 [Phycisphaerales bacterium]|nr:hypothetical protein [Phycisphaerales bacterium]
MRRRGRLTWTKLAAALGWFFVARERLQAPGTVALTEERLEQMEIDGGAGGDLDGALVTASTIGEALRELELAYPVRYAFVVATHRDGVPLRKLADKFELSHKQVSIELGHGESFLVGWLRRAEVLA